MKMIVFFFILMGGMVSSAQVKSTGYNGNMLSGVSVTIANAAQESSLVTLNGFALVGIQTPSVFTGTALTFESCASDGTGCVPVKTSTSGTPLSYTVTTSSYYAIAPADFEGIAYLKIKSGSSEGAARTLVVSLKGI